VEIVPKSGFYDFASKYTKGATDYIVPARLQDAVRERLQRTSERIWKVMNLSGFARMDFIVADGEGYFLEVNTIPGMTETSLVPKAAAAAGISFEDLCEEVLKSASLKI
jgi:D-alanine-D-alanine ligase